MRLIAYAASSVALPAAAVDRATPVQYAQVQEEPYKHSGVFSSNIGSGSGALVYPQVVLTAAHVVFDDIWLTWSTNNLFLHRHNHLSTDYPSFAARQMTGVKTWTQYSDASLAYSRLTDLSSLWPFNLDFAAVYRTHGDLVRSEYSSYVVQDPGVVSPLREDTEKLITGYPRDTRYVPPLHQGLMHSLGPKNWKFFDLLEDVFDQPLDPYGFSFAIYQVDDVEVHGGNSGGPVYIRDPYDDRWLQAAVVTGGNRPGTTPFTLVRAIDQQAHELIQSAMRSSGGGYISRVNPMAGPDGNQIAIRWESKFTKWEVARHDGPGWSLLKLFENPNGENPELVDTTAEPGIEYVYKVRAVGYPSPSPWSPVVSAKINGSNRNLGHSVGAPRLSWTTGGNAPWYPGPNGGAISGQIGNESNTWIETTVKGPGRIRFDWQVSSQKAQGRTIHDSLGFLINGAEMKQINGERTERSVSYQLKAGTHALRWIYRKDAHGKAGQDRATLSKVTFESSDKKNLIDGGYDLAEAKGWSYASWFGYYSPTADPAWVWHPNFAGEKGSGWVYMSGSPNDLWLYSDSPELGWTYTSPDIFPYLWSYGRSAWVYNYPEGNWFVDLTTLTHFQP